MTVSSITALYGAMIVLASVPDAIAISVVGRSVASGFKYALFAVLGIVVADYIFIVLVVGGVSTLFHNLDTITIVVKYLAGTYLIWYGIQLWKSQVRSVEVYDIKETSRLSSFLSGFVITAGDPKAILFYASFLPAFVDLSTISYTDILIIILGATISAGGTKLIYAYMGDRSRQLFRSCKSIKIMNISAAAVMIITGMYLLL